MKPTFTHNEMVHAMCCDDARYDGKFFVCVRTTGIYCLPSCKAKLPHLTNVIFVATRDEAIAAGFRGCKRCRSEFYPNTDPSWWAPVLSLMRQEQRGRIRERDISSVAGVDISTIRRYFKMYLNTTPMAYHRRIRIEHARRLMENGTDWLTAALESGFESSSGFRDAFVRHYGRTPGSRGNGRQHRL
jgi:AraC family transcriptional regulator of adaptative response/methylated-DNA-[protein]-cysteine methyltransferase